jgi:dolichol-phosphate mannosyltransferase
VTNTLSNLSLAIVCPMANEEATAVSFVKAVLQKCTRFPTTRFFAILDTVCRDRSLELLRELELKEPRLKVIWAPEDRSVVDAYVRGYHEALNGSFDWILEIDAGFSHNPEDIPKFLECIRTGCDCAFGSRFMPGGEITNGSLMRRAVSFGGTLLTNFLLGTKLSDMTSGFQLFRRDALEMVVNRGIVSRGHFFQNEIKGY